VGKVRIDEVGYWSEVKLDLVRKYAQAYSAIMSKQATIGAYLYIDGFAGAGVHLSRSTGEFIPGSPLNALNVDPPFSEYHFVDLDGGRAENLRSLAQGRDNVCVHEGDCNAILRRDVFPRARYADYRRALCLLDPYGLHLQWEVIKSAGESRSIEIFLNFPIMDINMNVLKHDPKRVDEHQRARMDAYWGDRTWEEAAYRKKRSLFGDIDQKTTNREVVAAFRDRLVQVAGFEYVPEPMPMRNNSGAVVFYLFFASPNKVGGKIVTEIFEKHRHRGIS